MSSLSDGEKDLLRHAQSEYEESYGKDSPTDMSPICIEIPFKIETVSELLEAIEVNHEVGLIDDNQREVALGFCENLRLTKRPDAELAEMMVRQENNPENNWLIIPLTLPKLG